MPGVQWHDDGEAKLTAIAQTAGRERDGHAGLWLGARLWLGLLCALVFGGECLAYGICVLTGARPPALDALVVAAGVALMMASLGAVFVDRLLLSRYRRVVSELEALRTAVDVNDLKQAGGVEMQRRLRHDLRGALSPALLIADRLINHEDPKVRRAGEIVVKSVDRASTLLADPAEPSLPGDP